MRSRPSLHAIFAAVAFLTAPTAHGQDQGRRHRDVITLDANVTFYSHTAAGF